MSAARHDVLAPLIAAGIELFSTPVAGRPATPVKRYNVLGWLFDTCVDAGVQLSGYEREYVVDEVQAAANGTLASHARYLTVGELRERIAGLPDNMPVFYERIEDSYFDKLHWTSHAFVSEERPAEDCDREAAASGKYPNFRVVTSPTGDMAQSLCQGLGAFTAYVATDLEGRKALVVTAHY